MNDSLWAPSCCLASRMPATRHRPPGETRGFFSEEDSEGVQGKDTDVSRSSKERTRTPLNSDRQQILRFRVSSPCHTVTNRNQREFRVALQRLQLSRNNAVVITLKFSRQTARLFISCLNKEVHILSHHRLIYYFSNYILSTWLPLLSWHDFYCVLFETSILRCLQAYLSEGPAHRPAGYLSLPHCFLSQLKKNFFCFVLVVLGCQCSSWASLIAGCGLSCPVACGILVPRPGIRLESPALEGGFLTTGPPGKSLS